jgi:hypothetical protein
MAGGAVSSRLRTAGMLKNDDTQLTGTRARRVWRSASHRRGHGEAIKKFPRYVV